MADLKGNIQAHPESDETFPRLKSQQRAVLQQLMSNPDPTIQAALREPANLGFIKSLIGLSELVVPGDDARDKQLREIQQLLSAGPVVMAGMSAFLDEAGTLSLRRPMTEKMPRAGKNGPRMTGKRIGPAHRVDDSVDEMLDDHATEFEECRRWASSDAGQIARAQNPAGFANVRAHAAEHAAALARQQAQAQAQAAPPAGAARPKPQGQS